ncbi:sigma-70 family RNA polymerase sigma factor [Novipirellula aureliae]|nr:sigma-70 family RNA polymerase sigma factor [Novipirellula aureliae]
MDNRSFQSFLNITENRSRILAMIVTMVRDFDVAEDLFQETVLEILHSEEQFDPTRSFTPWACGIAKNVVHQYWRRQKQSPANGLGEMIADLAMISAEGDDEMWHRERKALRSCFQKLPSRMQRLLLLRYGHNIKGPELAESAACRLGSIRTTLARLRFQLRQCIQAKTAES